MRPPEGLEAYRAAAWEVLAGGGSLTEAARAAAAAAGRPDRPYSNGTVQKWKTAWETDHGPEIFRHARADEMAARTEMARVAAEQAWYHLRTQEARNAGVTASQIRAQLLAVLPTVATSRVDRGPDGQAAPVVVPGPSARQIRDLADAYATLIRSAELLDDRPTVRTSRTLEGFGDHLLTDTGEPAGLLSNLEDHDAGSGEEVTLEAARLVLRRFRPPPSPSPEVIEAREAS